MTKPYYSPIIDDNGILFITEIMEIQFKSFWYTVNKSIGIATDNTEREKEREREIKVVTFLK